MGLLEKVSLLLIAVIIQTACTDCKPQSLKQNPFERYVRSRIKNTVDSSKLLYNEISPNNAQNGASTNPNIYKTFNFPEVDFPSDTLQREPSLFNHGSFSTTQISSNKKYDPTLLENFKEEARKKRKSKKQVNENFRMQTQLKDQPLHIVDKGVFPEVEYPLTAMDTWTPMYWNPLPHNIDEQYNQQNQYAHQNQANTKQRNILPTYLNRGNKKRTKGLTAAPKLKENKNAKMKSMNLGSNNISKIITPVESKTALVKNDTTNTNTLDSPQHRTIRRKLKKGIKSAGAINKLNNTRKQPIISLKTRPQYNISQETETLDLNYTNTSNKSMSNITTEIDSPVNYTIDGKVSKRIISSSSANVDNINEMDLIKLVRLSSSHIKDLAERVLKHIGTLPEEYRLPKDFFIPAGFTQDNLTVYDMSLENILDSSLSSKHMTSLDNFTKKSSKYPAPSPNMSNVTALYYLIEKVLDQIGSKQNYFDVPGHISAAIMNTGTSSTEYIVPNASVSDKMNDKVLMPSTNYIAENPLIKYYNKSDTSFSSPIERTYIFLSPDNHTTTDILSFCPVPVKDQCSVYNPPELNFPNNTFTLMEILNGTTSDKVLTTRVENSSFIDDNKILKHSLKDLNTLNVSNNAQTDNIMPYNISYEKRTKVEKPKLVTDNNTLNGMPKYETLKVVPEVSTLESEPDNMTMADISYKSSLTEHDTVANTLRISMLNNIPYNKTLVITFNAKSKGMAVNNIFLEMPGIDIIGEVAKYHTLSNISTSAMPEKMIMEFAPDMPKNSTLEYVTGNNKWSTKSKIGILSYVPENNTSPKVPQNATLEDVSEHDTDILSQKSHNEDLEGIISNYKLGNTQLNSVLSNIPDNYTEKDLLEYDTFLNMPDLEHFNNNLTSIKQKDFSNNECLANKSDKITFKGQPENDRLKKTLEYDTFSDTPHLKIFEDKLTNNNLNNTSENKTSTKMPVNEKVLGIPENETLENLSDTDDSKNLLKTMLNTLEYGKLTDVPDNNKLKEMPEFYNIPYNKILENIMSDIPGNDNLEYVTKYNPQYDKSEGIPDSLANMSNDSLLSESKVNNTDTHDTLSFIYDNDIDILYALTDSKEFGDIIIADNESLNTPADTKAAPDMFNLNDLSQNETVISILPRMVESKMNNNSDTRDTLSSIFDNYIDILSLVTDNKKVSEIVKADNETFNNPVDTKAELDMFKPNDLSPNVTAINVLPKTSNDDTDVNYSNATLNFLEIDTIPDLFKVPESTEVSEEFDTEIVAIPYVGGLFDIRPRSTDFNHSDERDTLSSIYDNDIDILSLITDNKKVGEIEIADNETLDNPVDTKAELDMFNPNDLSPNVSDINMLPKTSNKDTDVNYSNADVNFLETNTIPDLFKVPKSTEISDEFNTEIIAIPYVDGLFNIRLISTDFNHSDTRDTLSGIYDNDIDILSLITDNKNVGEIEMADNETLKNPADTKVELDIFNPNYLSPNVTAIINILPKTSNEDTDVNYFNADVNFLETDTTPDLFKVPDSTETSDEFGAKIVAKPYVNELFDIGPSSSNSIIPDILDTVKINVTDIDELLDVILEFLIEDLKTNMVSGRH